MHNVISQLIYLFQAVYQHVPFHGETQLGPYAGIGHQTNSLAKGQVISIFDHSPGILRVLALLKLVDIEAIAENLSKNSLNLSD